MKKTIFPTPGGFKTPGIPPKISAWEGKQDLLWFDHENLDVLRRHGQHVIRSAEIRRERDVIDRVGDASDRVGLRPFP